MAVFNGAFMLLWLGKGVFRAPALPPFFVRKKEAKTDLGAAAPKDPGDPGGLNIFWSARLESSCSARRWPYGVGTAGPERDVSLQDLPA